MAEIAKSEHLAKIHGLAVYVLKMPTKDKRRAFLAGFEDKHGAQICNELKLKIMELAK